jgi:hypothetical protein
MEDILIHPFDLSYEQITRHRKVYDFANRGQKNLSTTQDASLELVFINLAKKINLNTESWKHILKQFDQSSFAVEQISLKEAASQAKTVTPIEDRGKQELNAAQQQELVLLSSKIEFSDFLKAIQRESTLRDILSEHQLYFFSTKRLYYQQDTKLITKGALEAIKIAKQGNR